MIKRSLELATAHRSTLSRTVFYPHIEGLRAVAAILVAVYHLFFDRISGGVDVFFVLSGFLIMLSLLRLSDGGRLRLGDFLSGLLFRLFPLAGVVLLAVVIGSVLFLPEVGLDLLMKEVIASALYYENWQLAFQQTDYLNREEAASPVQHFWALSIQGQFYLLSAFLVWMMLRIGRNAMNYKSMVGVFGFLFALSFSYSVYQTYFGNQVWAYFDTFARYWEFILGILLAFWLVFNPAARLPAIIGWLGLAVVVLCGVIFQVGAVFPGAAALVPTLAAVLIVLGGQSDSSRSVRRLLGSPIFVSLGGVAYGIYLIHWPLLVFYREAVNLDVSLLAGLTILAASIILAYLVNWCIEKPFLSARRAYRAEGKSIKIAAPAAMAPVILAAGFGIIYLALFAATPSENIAGYPGARVLDGTDSWQVDLTVDEFFPTLAQARHNLPSSSTDGCHVRLREDVPVWCLYGDTKTYTRTLAIVGGSHSLQWLPALKVVAEQNNWRIVYSTWSACRFVLDYSDDHRCGKLVTQVMSDLLKMKPDLVFTTADSAQSPSATRPPENFVEPWRLLKEAGIRVAAIRDTPWFSEDVPRCLSRPNGSIEGCSARRTDVLVDEFDTSDVVGNTYIFDLSNYFCNSTICPAVIGSILVWSDRHHITAEYSRSLSEPMSKHMLAAMELVEAPSRVDEDFLASITDVRKQIAVLDAILSCGPAFNYGPFERPRLLEAVDDHFIFSRGAAEAFLQVSNDAKSIPEHLDKSFEWWKLNIDGDSAQLKGWYNDGGTALKEVAMHGELTKGELRLRGNRGPRDCELVAFVD